ncbi:hypothetical protein ECLT68_1530 [Escherichia coli LT-68]|nr:hypothetical protein ECLT68_1530 [Escherichia coli LT-68]
MRSYQPQKESTFVQHGLLPFIFSVLWCFIPHELLKICIGREITIKIGVK